MDTMTEETTDVAAQRGRRLAAWGTGALVKKEGLWRGRDGGFVVAERDGADGGVAFRVVDGSEAARLLHAHGHEWRSRRLVEPAEADAADADDAEGPGDAAETVAVTSSAAVEATIPG